MRRGLIAVMVVSFAICIAWWLQRRPFPALPAPPPEPHAVTPPAPDPTVAATRRAMPPPAIALERPVVLRPARAAVPGALEGTVVDAATGESIAGAELTFSHDEGAYSTVAGGGGAFRFAPPAPGTYRLVSVDAKGYAPFESEFGRSPVSFTSVAGKDVSGVALRLKREHRTHGKRRASGEERGADAGEPAATGALFGRVADARSGAPIAVFAVAVFRREGVEATAVAPASFVDPSGAYRIDGLSPGRYEATAMAAGYAASNYVVVQVAGSAVEADFALQAGVRIAGVVIDQATRLALSGASLSLEGRRGDSPNLPVAPLSPEAETGPDGRFVLEHVPPDAISMSVEKEGYLVRLVSLAGLPTDGDAPPLEIALTPRGVAADANVELTGIGAVLRPRGDVLRIQQVVPNGGAADAGLGPGDAIVTIDGTRVTELGFDRATGAIRGLEGTTVTLRIRRGDRELDVVVVRKLVRI